MTVCTKRATLALRAPSPALTGKDPGTSAAPVDVLEAHDVVFA
jgi:hypothetical protein